MSRFYFQLVLFLLIMLVGAEAFSRFCFGEILSRTYPERWNSLLWYQAIRNDFANSNYAVVVVGRSKTLVAINPKLASKTLSAELEMPVTVFNQGMTGATLIAHYFGIKSLLESRGNLKNVLVVIECPLGYPPPDTWTGNWSDPETPTDLGSVLSTNDIGKMWLTSSDSLLTKILATANHYLLTVRYFRLYRRIFEVFPERTILSSQILADPKLDRRLGGPATRAGLSAFRQKVKDLVAAPGFSNMVIDAQFSKDAVFRSLVTLCQQNGGCVYTYAPPESHTYPTSTDYSQSRQLIADYQHYCAEHGIHSIEVDRSYQSDAFPDLIHLGKSLQDDYTQRFSHFLADTCKQKRCFTNQDDK